jgi:hypothetical protein
MRRSRALFLSLAPLAVVAACGWNPSRPFERDAPPVKQALAALDAGDANAAADLLQRYLATGECKEGSIGTPEAVKDKPSGSFDLGLALFALGESFGGRLGDELLDAGRSAEATAARSAQIDCALKLMTSIGDDGRVPIDLRARARYLSGNLHFLAGAYEDAVPAYDHALALAPGMHDAGDPVGRDAAWNRAIAMRRIEDQKDAGSDAANEGGSDGGGDGASDSGGGSDAASDGGGAGDSGNDSGRSPDAGADSASPPQNQPDASAQPPPPPGKSQDDRILDQLENAPTVQEEAAKRQAAQRRAVKGMADK